MDSKVYIFDGSVWCDVCDTPFSIFKNGAWQLVDVTDNTKTIQIFDGASFRDVICNAPSGDGKVYVNLYMCYSDYPTNGITMTFSLTVDAGWIANGLMRMVIIDPDDDTEETVVYDGTTPLIAPITSPVSLPGNTAFNAEAFRMRITFRVTDNLAAIHLYYIDLDLIKTLPSGGSPNYRCTSHYTNLLMTEII